MYTLMIVEDEREIAELLAEYLRRDEYNIITCGCGKEAIDVIDGGERIDLALLDIMLPDMDGFDICAYIRTKHNFPIIMLTAKAEDDDKVRGLAVGADDYITKPFSLPVVAARVKAQLRRYTKYNDAEAEDKSIIDFSGLTLNRNSHTCTVYDEPIQLTPTEFDILWLLAENRGTVFSAEDIFVKIWGTPYFSGSNTVMVHIRRIREKMHEPLRSPQFIKTVWGVGYKIE